MRHCRVLECEHCGAANAVSTCKSCGRSFVISVGRVEAGERLLDDAALCVCPDHEVQPCDFCLAKSRGCNSAVVITTGLRQKTCAHCRTEFLASHGL